jgi:hypothetical protein
MAMSHYSKAVKSVRDALRDYQDWKGNEWLLATVNALHIFEVSSPTQNASQDARILLILDFVLTSSFNDVVLPTLFSHSRVTSVGGEGLVHC